jgi:hypothetical protein
MSPPPPDRPFDFRGPLVSVQFVMAEFAPEAADKPGPEPAKGAVSVGALDLSAPSERIAEGLRKTGLHGRLDVLYRMQLTTVDGQKAKFELGHQEPQITGVTMSTFGQTNSIQYTNTGLILEIEPRVDVRGTVSLKVSLNESRFGREEEGTPISITAKGETIRARPISTLSVQTAVNVPSGQTIAIGGLASVDGPRRRQMVLLVSARIIPLTPHEAIQPQPGRLLPRPDPRYTPPSPPAAPAPPAPPAPGRLPQ